MTTTGGEPHRRVSIEEIIAEQEAQAAAFVPDPYGVPSNIFGPVPEGLYGLIGRITMLWPVVEKELHWLHDVLTGSAQDVAAGLPFAQLHEACIKALGSASELVRQCAEPALTQVKAVAERRNEIVHSMFPDPTLEKARGHRPVRPRQRPASGDWTVWIETGEAQLRELIAAEVGAMESMEKARLWIQSMPDSERESAKLGPYPPRPEG